MQSSLTEAGNAEEALCGLQHLRQKYRAILTEPPASGQQAGDTPSLERAWLFRLYLEMGEVVRDLQGGMTLQDAVRELDIRRSRYEKAKRH